jgi:hypothetical protein
MRSHLLLLALAGCAFDLERERLGTPLAGEAEPRCVHAGVPDVVSLDFGDQLLWVFADGTATTTAAAPNACAGELAATGALLALTDEELAFEAGDPAGRRVALQPMAGVVVDGVGWLFYRKVLVAGLFATESVGVGVARIDGPAAPAVREVPAVLDGEPTLTWRAPDDDWGDAAVALDGAVAVLGCRGEGFDAPCWLARAPVAQLADPAAWEVRDLDGWSADRDAAVSVVDAADTISLGWNPHLAAWLMVYAPPLDDRVVARTAAALEGPWGFEQELFVGDPPASFWIHGVAWHPGAHRDGDVLGITYGSDGGLRWVEVTLP